MIILGIFVHISKQLKILFEAIFKRHNSLLTRRLKQASFDLSFLSNLSMLSIKDKFAFFQIQLCLLTNEKIFQISFEI